jgi:hypothetical protein
LILYCIISGNGARIGEERNGSYFRLVGEEETDHISVLKRKHVVLTIFLFGLCDAKKTDLVNPLYILQTYNSRALLRYWKTVSSSSLRQPSRL